MPKSRVRNKKKRNKSQAKREFSMISISSQFSDQDLDFLLEVQKLHEFKKLLLISNRFHEVYEEYVYNRFGTCYIQGYCMTEILRRFDFKARCVTGKVALRMKDTNRYAMYGKLPKKGNVIGSFHTWTEVEIDGSKIIIDTSTQDNIKGLKPSGYEIDPRINGIIITKHRDNILYKFKEESNLRSYPQFLIEKEIGLSTIYEMINETCVRVYS